MHPEIVAIRTEIGFTSSGDLVSTRFYRQINIDTRIHVCSFPLNAIILYYKSATCKDNSLIESGRTLGQEKRTVLLLGANDTVGQGESELGNQELLDVLATNISSLELSDLYIDARQNKCMRMVQ